jgi:hypothetical protein
MIKKRDDGKCCGNCIETALPKSAEQLMEEFNNLNKTGTYNAFLEDYVR